MKIRSTFLPFLLTAPFASATTFLVDLNTNSPDNSSRPGGTWNQYAAPADINAGFLVDDFGSTTLATLSRTGTFTDNGNNGTVVYDPSTLVGGVVSNPSWVAAVGSNGASGDNFFTSNSATTTPHTYSLIFGGLQAGSALSLDLLASRASDSGRGFFDYSLDGGINWLGFTVLNADGSLATTDGWDTNTTATQFFHQNTQGFTLHRYMNMSGTLASGVTELHVRTTDADTATATFSVMNALRLTGTAIPEPSAAALLLLGAAGLVMRRRR